MRFLINSFVVNQKAIQPRNSKDVTYCYIFILLCALSNYDSIYRWRRFVPDSVIQLRKQANKLVSRYSLVIACKSSNLRLLIKFFYIIKDVPSILLDCELLFIERFLYFLWRHFLGFVTSSYCFEEPELIMTSHDHGVSLPSICPSMP